MMSPDLPKYNQCNFYCQHAYLKNVPENIRDVAKVMAKAGLATATLHLSQSILPPINQFATGFFEKEQRQQSKLPFKELTVQAMGYLCFLCSSKRKTPKKIFILGTLCL